MMEGNVFYEVMQGHRTEKLLDIVENKRSDYQPDALAAAETVLRERNISWKEKTAQKEALVFQNVQDEITQRLATGENIDVIRRDMKARGLDVFEYAETDQEEAEKKDPAFAAQRSKWGIIAAAIAIFFYGVSRTSRTGMRHNGNGMLVSMAIFGTISTGLIIYALVKKK